MHLKQIDLVNEFGGKNRVSEILNRKRKLTVEMIRKLTTRLNLSPELLINDYQLTRQSTVGNKCYKKRRVKYIIEVSSPLLIAIF